MKVAPRAFLCHASEDNALARRVADDLQRAGIVTFFDDWSLVSGDSLRQKIDAGLVTCTHFIVLLTQASIKKPWVNAEIDAAFAKRLQGTARLIPLRYQLEPALLPPLLAGTLSPQLDDYDEGLRRLVDDIHEVSRRPPLGAPPKSTAASLPRSMLSLSAQAVARFFLEASENGLERDPEVSVPDLLTATGLSHDDLEVAVANLESYGWVTPLYSALGLSTLRLSQSSRTRRPLYCTRQRSQGLASA